MLKCMLHTSLIGFIFTEVTLSSVWVNLLAFTLFGAIVFFILRLHHKYKSKDIRKQLAASEALARTMEHRIEKLSVDLDKAHRKMVSCEALVESKNIKIEELIVFLKAKDDTLNQSKKNDYVIKTLRELLRQGNVMQQFFVHFQGMNVPLFSNLVRVNDRLTQNELKHCAYIYMGLDCHQVAELNHISPGSVRVAQMRLKKRLKLEENDSLNSFIHRLSKAA